MKKKFSLLLLVLTIALSIACSSEDNNKDSFVDVTVQITSEQTIKDYSNFQVTVTELKSGTTFTEKASVVAFGFVFGRCRRPYQRCQHAVRTCRKRCCG